MKILGILILCIFISMKLFAQDKDKTCVGNEDALYDRKTTLKSISKELNQQHRYYLRKYSKKYKAIDENFYNFFIYDLVDTLNVTPNAVTPNQKCIEFKNNHVYHIGAIRTIYKISLILILSEGKLHFFKGLNCYKKINTIEEVISLIEKEIPNKLDKIAIERIRNFNKYKKDLPFCGMGIIPACECPTD